jgi:hypothetical protein
MDPDFDQNYKLFMFSINSTLSGKYNFSSTLDIDSYSKNLNIHIKNLNKILSDRCNEYIISGNDLCGVHGHGGFFRVMVYQNEMWKYFHVDGKSIAIY